MNHSLNLLSKRTHRFDAIAIRVLALARAGSHRQAVAPKKTSLPRPACHKGAHQYFIDLFGKLAGLLGQHGGRHWQSIATQVECAQATSSSSVA